MFRFVLMLGCFALALHGAHVHSQGFESAGLDDTANPSHSLAKALLALSPVVPTSARRSMGTAPEHMKCEKECSKGRVIMANADEIPDVGRGAKVRQFLRENPEGMVVMKLQGSGIGRSGKANMMAYRSTNGNPNAFYADEERRGIMNLLMFGSAGGFALPFLLTYVYYFIPPIPDANKGIPAKTGIGKEIFFKEWYSTHEAGDRDLVQGVKGQATWLIINEEGKVKDFAVTAVCTHLGCIVPWNKGQNKFMCPCHGSQYDTNGKVVRGPAPLSLALQHVDEGPKDAIYVRQWTERDFRTGEAPWWIK